MKKITNAIAAWLAYSLPRRVVYHAVIRAWAHATTGPWSHVEAPAATALEVLERWDGKQP